MKEKVLETIKKYNLIENGDKIVIGVSGGPDSITLLNVLLEIKNENFKQSDFNINNKVRNMTKKENLSAPSFCFLDVGSTYNSKRKILNSHFKFIFCSLDYFGKNLGFNFGIIKRGVTFDKFLITF